MDRKEDCFHLGVKALIFNEKNKMLLLERHLPSKKMYWDIPGGRLQRGESLMETLMREVKEETGFEKISDIRPFTMLLTNIRIPAQEGDVGLIFSIFYCKILGIATPILSDEHVGFDWLDPKEAARKLEAQYPPEFLANLALITK
ncbi:MAG: NUDIX hydrolase [Chlamydiales bacterium]|nr:NUDIX hydrolase [Chlamydiales bacterium]